MTPLTPDVIRRALTEHGEDISALQAHRVDDEKRVTALSDKVDGIAGDVREIMTIVKRTESAVSNRPEFCSAHKEMCDEVKTLKAIRTGILGGWKTLTFMGGVFATIATLLNYLIQHWSTLQCVGKAVQP